jgi:hypothetical protein
VHLEPPPPLSPAADAGKGVLAAQGGAADAESADADARADTGADADAGEEVGAAEGAGVNATARARVIAAANTLVFFGRSTVPRALCGNPAGGYMAGVYNWWHGVDACRDLFGTPGMADTQWLPALLVDAGKAALYQPAFPIATLPNCDGLSFGNRPAAPGAGAIAGGEPHTYCIIAAYVENNAWVVAPVMVSAARQLHHDALGARPRLPRAHPTVRPWCAVQRDGAAAQPTARWWGWRRRCGSPHQLAPHRLHAPVHVPRGRVPVRAA